jgi:hypothetical protein
MSELRTERAPATIPPATTVVMASTAIVSSKEAPLLMEVYSGVEPRSCVIGFASLQLQGAGRLFNAREEVMSTTCS